MYMEYDFQLIMEVYMSAIEYITLGGIASLNENLPEDERYICDQIVKKFGEDVKTMAHQFQIPASKLLVFKSSCLYIGRSFEYYYFIYSDNSGDNTIIYTDITSLGDVSLPEMVNHIKLEIGNVPWAFAISKSSFTLNNETLDNEIRDKAQKYVSAIRQGILPTQDKKQHEVIIVPELETYINKFRLDYPTNIKTAFIMMQFSNTPAHNNIVKEIKRVLEKNGIKGFRADEKEYADDLFTNVRTYLHCCDFGIAVFERLLNDDFNPNVSLEVGYMFGLAKQVCLLKDQTLRHLHTDLVGKLYKEFNPQDINGTIESQLEKWLSDKGYK